MGLLITKLHDILSQINADRTKREQFASKWFAAVNFLYANTGLKITQLGKPNTVAKLSIPRKSDLDIIFNISPEKPRKDIYPKLESQIKTFYGNSVNILQTPETVQIDFKEVKCKIDFVLVNATESKNEGYAMLRDFHQVDQTPLDGIKLIKHGFNIIGIFNKISTGLIEKTAFSNPSKDLVAMVEKTLFQLSNEIRATGRKPEDVIKIFK